MLTGGSHAKEIRLYNLGPLLMRRFRDLRRKLRKERLRITGRRSVAELAAQTCATAAIYGSLAFIAYRTMQGTNTLGDMIMYFMAFQRGQGFLQGMLGGLAGIYEDNLFLSNMHEFLGLKRKVVEPAHAITVPRPMQTGIVLNHVSFQYPTGARKVLEDVSLAIRLGKVIALVGENGSGKTTLVKLLCRLYDLRRDDHPRRNGSAPVWNRGPATRILRPFPGLLTVPPDSSREYLAGEYRSSSRQRAGHSRGERLGSG
jgi:ATP-binding cassette subfamily B protein